MKVTPMQVRAARAALQLTQKEFAKRCWLSLDTLKRIELSPGLRLRLASKTHENIIEGCAKLDVYFVECAVVFKKLARE